MKPDISLSPTAVAKINEILTAGKRAEIGVRNGKLAIYEIPKSTKKYEVVVAQPR